MVLYLSDETTDKGDAPGKLVESQRCDQVEAAFGGAGKGLTVAMEMVARAKGSPRMLPIWIPLRREPYIILELSILASDGEASEPYDGIRKEGD